MPVIKDVVKEYHLTSDVPAQFGGSTPTYNSYKGSGIPERLGDGSEHPTEEPVQQAVLDGRQVQASNELAFTQMIIEMSGSDTIFEDLKQAAEENGNIWIVRSGLASNAGPEVIGGDLGLTVSVGRARQGPDGHRMFQCLFEGVGTGPGTIIEEFTGTL